IAALGVDELRQTDRPACAAAILEGGVADRAGGDHRGGDAAARLVEATAGVRADHHLEGGDRAGPARARQGEQAGRAQQQIATQAAARRSGPRVSGSLGRIEGKGGHGARPPG
ncbi:MAG: hypothetical protein ACK56I_18475, partial [bacterium]